MGELLKDPTETIGNFTYKCLTKLYIDWLWKPNISESITDVSSTQGFSGKPIKTLVFCT